MTEYSILDIKQFSAVNEIISVLTDAITENGEVNMQVCDTNIMNIEANNHYHTVGDFSLQN